MADYFDLDESYIDDLFEGQEEGSEETNCSGAHGGADSLDEQADNIANDIAEKDAVDSLSGTGQVEYGATIAQDKNGALVSGKIRTGQSYDSQNPPETRISPPTGYQWADVVGVIHSHPPSGDADTDLRNQAPSNADWEAADQIVALGADSDQLRLYIIDKDGTLRAYDYQTPAEREAIAGNPSGSANSAAAANPDDVEECSAGNGGSI